jgi:type VI secretion system protein ImpH
VTFPNPFASPGLSNTNERAVEPPVAAENPPAAPATSQPAVDPLDALFRQLAENPCDFDWFHAVRRLECALPGKPRIGASNRVTEDAVRFCQEATLAFAPATIARFEPGVDNRAPRLTAYFFGMLGANGPMPLHMTEYARDRLRNSGDPTLVRFLDVFHHRMMSLFYRAWASNRQTVSYDRAAAETNPANSSPAARLRSNAADAAIGDRFAVYISSLIGRGMGSLMGRDNIKDSAKLHYSGRLSCSTAHAEGLEAILSNYLDVPCVLEPFVGQWTELPEDSRCILGRSPETGTLGQTAIAGTRVWDVQSKFRIRLGPMNFAKFSSLLPGQSGNAELRDWIRNYVGDSLAWEARVVLAKEHIPKIKLGSLGHVGRSTWLHAGPVPADVDDLLLSSN